MIMRSMRQQFVDTMLDVGREDSKLAVLVGDISHFSLQPFAQACPGRYYNVGICEPTIISMAAGLAKVGLYPVAHTIAPFLIERSFEQIKLDFCYQQLGGNLISVGSAFDYSNLGSTHHCYGDFALLKTLQRTQIMYPASPEEFDSLFRQTYQNGLLSYFRLPAQVHNQYFNEKIEVGKGIKVVDGENITLIATGPHLQTVLMAQNRLQAMGWNPEIIYIHTIRPLDVDLIYASAKKTRRVMVIEEHMESGGLGDDVLRATRKIEQLQFSSLSIPDTFLTDYGTYAEQCERLGFTSEGILRRVENVFEKA